jgi:hypothetical protein
MATAVAIATVASGIALSAPANAIAAGRSDCSTIYPQSTLCLWSNYQFTGTLWAFTTQQNPVNQEAPWMIVGLVGV